MAQRKKFSNGLSDAELERLSILSEELGEAVQAVGKIMRHGYESYNPLKRGGLSNREELEKELGDIRFIVNMMKKRDDLDEDSIELYCERKATKITPYLHHQS